MAQNLSLESIQFAKWRNLWSHNFSSAEAIDLIFLTRSCLQDFLSMSSVWLVHRNRSCCYHYKTPWKWDFGVWGQGKI